MLVALEADDGSEAVTGSSLTLSGGVARWTGQLPEHATVGDVLVFEYTVVDPVCTEPFTNRLNVEVVPRSNRSSGGGKPKKRGNEGEGDADGQSGHALPDVVPVHRGEWEEHDFDEASALNVRRSGGDKPSYDFFFNVDNESLLRAQKANPNDADLIRERFRCALVLVGLAILQPPPRRAKDTGDNSATSESSEDLVSVVTRALAPVVLTLVDVVGALSVDPTS